MCFACIWRSFDRCHRIPGRTLGRLILLPVLLAAWEQPGGAMQPAKETCSGPSALRGNGSRTRVPMYTPRLLHGSTRIANRIAQLKHFIPASNWSLDRSGCNCSWAQPSSAWTATERLWLSGRPRLKLTSQKQRLMASPVAHCKRRLCGSHRAARFHSARRSADTRSGQRVPKVADVRSVGASAGRRFEERPSIGWPNQCARLS